MGRKKFNMDPKKGLEFLIQHGLVQGTAESVAQFLYKGEGLNKTAIGDYLGERSEFNEAVLKAFVALHDFSDLILVQALRCCKFLIFLNQYLMQIQLQTIFMEFSSPW